MRPWFERWPEFLQRELARFSVRGYSYEVDEVAKAQGRLVVKIQVPLDGRSEPMTVVFPDSYPEMRFELYADGELRLSRHQNPFEGNLCLLQQGGYRWTSGELAADVIATQLGILLDASAKGATAVREAEAPQAEPSSAYLPFVRNGGILVPEAALSLNGAEGGSFEVLPHGRFDWLLPNAETDPSRVGSGLLSSVSFGSESRSADPLLAGAFRRDPLLGVWVRCKPPSSFSSPMGFVDQLLPHLKRPLPKTVGNFEIALVAGVFDEEVSQGKYELAWTFLARASRKKERPHFQLMRGMRFTRSDVTARVQEIGALANRTVAVVGLGALGAAAAIELAKSQVGKLVLLDHDYVDPAAGPRWVTQLSGAGAEKGRELAALIAREYPWTKTELIAHRIGEAGRKVPLRERSELAILERLFNGADLVLDCTAEPNVTGALTHFALESRKPQVIAFGWDGLGGVVLRHVPGGGCFRCFQLAVHDGTIEHPLAADAGVRPDVQPRGCAAPTFISTSAELLPIVAQALVVAFGLLCGPNFPASPSDVLVFQLRKSDGSMLSAPQWSGFALPRRTECPFCGENAGS